MKYGIRLAVPAELVDDQPALTAFMLSPNLAEQWRDAVRADHGEPIGEPTADVQANYFYGEEREAPDGSTYVDHVKAYLVVSGEARRI